MKSNLFDTDLEAIEILQTLFNRCSLPELKAFLDAVDQGITKAWMIKNSTTKVSNEQNINV